MLQEAHFATIWTETGINPDCWHMGESWEKQTRASFLLGMGAGYPLPKIFTINIFFKKCKKREEKEEIAYHEHP